MNSLNTRLLSEPILCHTVLMLRYFHGGNLYLAKRSFHLVGECAKSYSADGVYIIALMYIYHISSHSLVGVSCAGTVHNCTSS